MPNKGFAQSFKCCVNATRHKWYKCSRNPIWFNSGPCLPCLDMSISGKLPNQRNNQISPSLLTPRLNNSQNPKIQKWKSTKKPSLLLLLCDALTFQQAYNTFRHSCHSKKITTVTKNTKSKIQNQEKKIPNPLNRKSKNSKLQIIPRSKRTKIQKSNIQNPNSKI